MVEPVTITNRNMEIRKEQFLVAMHAVFFFVKNVTTHGTKITKTEHCAFIPSRTFMSACNYSITALYPASPTLICKHRFLFHRFIQVFTCQGSSMKTSMKYLYHADAHVLPLFDTQGKLSGQIPRLPLDCIIISMCRSRK